MEDERKKQVERKVPAHVGYILDGNRRWARKHGLPTYEGHLAGYSALKDIIEATAAAGVQYISFYTFSTENWNRAEDEVRGIMKLIRRLFKTDIKELAKKGYKLVVMGGRDRLPDDICRMIDEAETVSAQGSNATLVMCFNYGGQQEIVRAVNRALSAHLQDVQADLRGATSQTYLYEVPPRKDARKDTLQIKDFERYLDHPEIPPVDLIVRTSGEQRLSNFMLWRSAYSELLFLEKFWPDMRTEDVTAILEEYNRRERRHGG